MNLMVNGALELSNENRFICRKDKDLSVDSPLLQIPLIYPGLQPLSQCPVCLLQGELFRQ